MRRPQAADLAVTRPAEAQRRRAGVLSDVGGKASVGRRFTLKILVISCKDAIFVTMSHLSLTYHLVFGTYCRIQVITPDHEKELYKFMCDFASVQGVYVRRIGGMPDHVHILCDIPPKIAVADFIRLLKSESSKFLRVNPHFPFWEKWAEGYGAFTVDASSREARRQYIMNQKEHHRRLSFAEEYRNFLLEMGFTETTPILGDK
ncbi:MAG: IS200/IS605 family transposase [Bacteroidales bacterium]|nr:IS200/IS605 family transposase [Bacteroidales bacterium]